MEEMKQIIRYSFIPTITPVVTCRCTRTVQKNEFPETAIQVGLFDKFEQTLFNKLSSKRSLRKAYAKGSGEQPKLYDDRKIREGCFSLARSVCKLLYVQARNIFAGDCYRVEKGFNY